MSSESAVANNSSSRLPVVYLPHGGGPFSYVEFGVPRTEVEELTEFWRRLASFPAQRPRALLVISAHWEERLPTLMTAAKPSVYYDYYGFPPEAYEIQWPAPGDPTLAAHVEALLEDAGIATATDDERGFDHGTFIPLSRSFPEAEIPTIQLSLQQDLDPEEHLDIGRALAPLRDEGVYIVGSGMSYHNMRGFSLPQAADDANRFDAWLQEAVALPRAERERKLAAWDDAPAARRSHPRHEHLLPLTVIAGAAGDDAASIPFNGTVFGKRISAVLFGGDCTT